MTNMQIDEESSLNIFEMFVEISEPTKEVVNKELQMFKKFQVNVKDIKCLLKWWEKHVSISNCGISHSLHSWHCWFSNKDKEFFIGWNFYKFEEMLLTIK